MKTNRNTVQDPSAQTLISPTTATGTTATVHPVQLVQPVLPARHVQSVQTARTAQSACPAGAVEPAGPGRAARPERGAEPPAAPAAPAVPEAPQPAGSPELLYDPAEAARIVRHLTDGYFAPEYILLFGKLVGGTPHSDPAAYDLLVAVRDTPRFDWLQAKRMLRCKMPYCLRKITYINLYILPLNYIESNRTPFLHFAHAEGTLLHCSDRHCFRRPKRPMDFARAYADARFHYDAFRTLGSDLLEQAQTTFAEGHNVRLAVHFTAQAAVYYYHALYYVYHGMPFDLHDPVVMHDRMRTLSSKLMLVFDDNRIENIFTIPRLKEVLMKRTYDADFYMAPQEAELHMDRVQQAAEIIESCAEMRLELYKELSENR